MPYNKHLTIDERKIIETGLDNNSTKAAISKTLGRDPSTIGKEIKKHAQAIPLSIFSGPLSDCQFLKSCPAKPCRKCEKYAPAVCKRLERAGVCNGCPLISSVKCKKQKYRYQALKAQEEYDEEKTDARQGVNLTVSQASAIADIIKPLIDNGQSPYAIAKNHPELNICEKTLYNYIEEGVFSRDGLVDLNLRRKVSMKMPKSKKTICSRPREQRKFLKGRTTKDFEKFITENPGKSIVEMDTVYNDETKGPFIQTFYICELNFMIGIYHERKTAEEMTNGLKRIQEWMGEENYHRYFQVLRPDRGSEFTEAEEYEKTGCRVFYCDPMASWQKPHVERTHELFRFICPKEKDLYQLGLRDQDDVNLIFSHINSYAREELQDKSPIDIYLFFHNGDDTLLKQLHLDKIHPDDIVLTPKLIKKN